uniref:Olfactory receptor n=1 Tax=Sphenodon punctatus TaxID=8508 RepID=A0A8D0G0Y6_SPHPU
MKTMTNATRSVTHFVLLGFPSLSPPLRLCLCSLLAVCYALTLLGNLCIMWAVLHDPHLGRLPMYILLGNFSWLELCYVTTTAPRMLYDLMSPAGAISFQSCFLQFYFFFSLGATECLLLSAMALDRYLAICHPLRYPMLMSHRYCLALVTCCWVTGFLWFMMPIVMVSRLPFCGPNLDHYVCDLGPLLAASCSPAPVTNTVCSVSNVLIIFSTLSFIVGSYTAVLRAVVRLPSAEGRRKTFSTCSSHLAVVSLFYGSIMVTYISPEASGGSNKVVALCYTVVTPLLNPLIYSLRNKEMKQALRRTLLRRH